HTRARAGRERGRRRDQRRVVRVCLVRGRRRRVAVAGGTRGLAQRTRQRAVSDGAWVARSSDPGRMAQTGVSTVMASVAGMDALAAPALSAAERAAPPPPSLVDGGVRAAGVVLWGGWYQLV